jgi:hypothetical protein
MLKLRFQNKIQSKGKEMMEQNLLEKRLTSPHVMTKRYSVIHINRENYDLYNDAYD